MAAVFWLLVGLLALGLLALGLLLLVLYQVEQERLALEQRIGAALARLEGCCQVGLSRACGWCEVCAVRAILRGECPC